jgi:WD40 repeat protein
VWDAKTGGLIDTLQKQSGLTSGPEATMHQDVHSVGFSSTGLVVTAHEDGIARIWKSGKDNPVVIRASDTDRLKCAAFSPDGSSLVTASEDGTVRLWATRDGKALSDPLKLLQDEFPLCAAFSHDGKEVFAVSNAGNVWRWDAIHPKQAPMPIRALRRDLTAASIGPDARTLIATGSENGRSVAWLWGADPASPPTELLNQAFVTNFAAEGTRVGTLDANQTLTIWDVASGRPISTFTGQEIAALSASAGGRREGLRGQPGSRKSAGVQGVQQVRKSAGRCATAGGLRDADLQTRSVVPGRQSLRLPVGAAVPAPILGHADGTCGA